MQTNQEIFDVVLFALREQGVASADGEACMYRGPNGTKCAAGHLIPDELYLPSMECTQFYGLYKQEKYKLASVFTSENKTLISYLQTAHDQSMPTMSMLSDGRTMVTWERMMWDIADKFNLVYTPA